MDLLPFATVGNGPQGDAYVLENILLFIPFSILLPISFQRTRRFWFCAGLGFLVSVVIETSQFLTKRGFVQTDDVITNTLGEYSGPFYTTIPALGNRESGVEETALPIYRKPVFRENGNR